MIKGKSFPKQRETHYIYRVSTIGMTADCSSETMQARRN